ncbi:hypothetical protein ACFKHW_39390 (plasmid) [Bradyrhizobium lupini]|uniref:hypothetical protein n=1 Tax=Rhizobium lupini TaxID=136996 RepID=UPI00366EC74D
MRIGKPESLQQDHSRERCQEWGDLALGDEEAVEQADDDGDRRRHRDDDKGHPGRPPEKPLAIAAAVAIIEATERSRPRTTITKLCPMATIASGATPASPALLRSHHDVVRLVGDRGHAARSQRPDA